MFYWLPKICSSLNPGEICTRRPDDDRKGELRKLDRRELRRAVDLAERERHELATEKVSDLRSVLPEARTKARAAIEPLLEDD